MKATAFLPFSISPQTAVLGASSTSGFVVCLRVAHEFGGPVSELQFVAQLLGEAIIIIDPANAQNRATMTSLKVKFNVDDMTTQNSLGSRPGAIESRRSATRQSANADEEQCVSHDSQSGPRVSKK
jgi:hypothetical protein